MLTVFKMESEVINFLKENVKPAAGCTEIVAIGLASSIAYNAIYGNFPKNTGLATNESVPFPKREKLEEIKVVLDRNVFKNAYGVAIPNTNKRGIKLATVLGMYLDMNRFFKDETDTGYLEIFKQLDKSLLPLAETMVSKVHVEVDHTKSELYIYVKLVYDKNVAEVALIAEHDNIAFIKLNERMIYKREGKRKITKKLNKTFSLNKILDKVEKIGDRELAELQKTVDVNKLLVEEGLLGNYGMGIVKKYKKLIKEGLLPDDLQAKIKLQVAAGIEARMGGADYPAMSSSGSGNNGIVATLPIIVVGENLDIKKDKILKGILVSHMIVKEASNYIGNLSALCGACNKAAFGAAAGLTYVLGGNKREIENAVKYVASNITGVVCDGAKYGCVLKAVTAACVAYEAALMSLKGLDVPDDGIVDKNVDKTLENVGKVAKAMSNVDDVVVKIIQEKEEFA